MSNFTSLSSLLRASTQLHHRKAEARVDLRRWLLDRNTYAAFLRRHEALWDGLAALLADTEPRFAVGVELAAAFRADVLALGPAVPPPAPFAANLWQPRPSSPAELRGLGYVALGSRRGGRAIAAQVERALGPDVPVDALTTDDADWSATLRWIDEVPPTQDAVEAATRAAVRAFALVSEHLTPEPLER